MTVLEARIGELCSWPRVRGSACLAAHSPVDRDGSGLLRWAAPAFPIGHYVFVVNEPPINFRRLRIRGRRPSVGDIFAMGLPDGDFVFGRVIAGPLSRSQAPMPGAYLVYIYRHRSKEPQVDLSELRPQDLLIAPAFINQLGWTKGYFLPAGSGPVSDADRLPSHCFRRFNGDYLNESGEHLTSSLEPCGDWGLGNHRTLDDQVSEALGIPLAPVV